MSRFSPQPPLNNEILPVANSSAALVPRETRDEQGRVVQYFAEETDESGTPAKPEIDWLQLAHDSYETSTQWLQSDHYAQWERNIANFKSMHPPGSKYHSAAYKYRSKMFRPKTRTAVRKLEAGVISALFNNKDILSIEAQNMSDPAQLASAAINKELIQERLTGGSIPWYATVVGAVQDAANYGSVISYQHWDYAEDLYGDVKKDKPCIELVPPENIRIDQAAQWTDPINDSPYLIHLMPMYIGDVLAKMKELDPKTGQPEWKPLDAADLRSASKEDFDGLRAQRHAPQTDPLGTTKNVVDTDFDTVWIHRNFIRKGGVDYVYYTAGTTHLLSDPIPTVEAYPFTREGERPYVKGTTALESHKVHPDSYTHLSQNLQSIANDIANRRHDNVLLAMDKRFLLRREANIDRDQLFRTVPGGGIETDDPVADVKVIETNDVTGSAYAEQDRINMDMDDLMGQFSQGTKQQGAKGDSVGGMNMVMSDVGGMTDYVIRTFLTTWVQPVMDQMIRMEQYYENDMMMIAVAAQKADIYVKFGISQITDELLRHSLTTNINVGIGATDPARKIDMLMQATNTLIQMPGVVDRINTDEFIKEIYGAIGYQDGVRFVKPVEEGEPTAKEQELMEQLEELMREKEGKVVEGQMRIAMEEVRQAGQVEERRIAGEYTLALESMKQRIDDMNVLIAAEKNDLARGELEMERDALVFQMKAQQLNIKLENERESRQIARDFMKEGETGKTTTPESRSHATSGRASPRVADSGAGLLMRNQYGNVPFAEG